MGEPSLYDRLGGVYAISAVIDYFSDQLVEKGTIERQNPNIKDWNEHEAASRLPGLKFLRTLWVCAIAGGPFEYCRRAFGPTIGFVAGMATLVEFLFAPPAIALAIGSYVHVQFPGLSPRVVAVGAGECVVADVGRSDRVVLDRARADRVVRDARGVAGTAEGNEQGGQCHHGRETEPSQAARREAGAAQPEWCHDKRPRRDSEYGATCGDNHHEAEARHLLP